MTNKNEKDTSENLGSFYMGRTRMAQPPQRRLPAGALTTAILIVFAGVLWYAYPKGQEKYSDMDVPVVQADSSAVKGLPSDPGGMEVRHQDSTVFNSLEKKASSGETEKILPGAEEPVDKDQAVASSAAGAKMASGLNLDLQTKGAGIEKVVSTANPEEPRTAGKLPEPDKVDAKKVTAPVKAESVNAADSVYIQLGAYRDMAGVQKDWTRIKAKYPQLLGPLSMRTEKVNLPKGTFYRLQAGKLSAARAREVCSGIKKGDIGGCVLVK